MSAQDDASDVVAREMVLAGVETSRRKSLEYKHMTAVQKVRKYGVNHKQVGIGFENASKFKPEQAVNELGSEMATDEAFLEPATSQAPSASPDIRFVGDSWCPATSDPTKRKTQNEISKMLRKSIHKKIRDSVSLADVTKRYVRTIFCLYQGG